VPLPQLIAQRIETMILEGVLRPGERLIAERDLAENLGVSRPSLRQALGLLEDKGLLVLGRHGATVANFLARLVDPLAQLLAGSERAGTDFFEYRLSIEAQATALAAQRATEPDRRALRGCLERMRVAHGARDARAAAECDVELHGLIYEAAHNVVLIHIMRVLRDLMQRDIFYSRERLSGHPGVREAWMEQHLAIVAAVLARDPPAAERAARAHVAFTSAAVDGLRGEDRRTVASLRRIERGDLVAARHAVRPEEAHVRDPQRN
jgi:GntR family transcriptional repressor for pyruvate dehydrogenase complex